MGNHRPTPSAHVVVNAPALSVDNAVTSTVNPEQTPRRLRVVAADAHWGMDLLYEEMLPRLGHQVVVARDGRSLREICRRMRPDLVLLEVQLPDGDGLETAQNIYNDCPVPFLLVSAEQHLLLSARVEQAEYVFGWLPKPITERLLAPAMLVAAARFRQLWQLRSGIVEENRRTAEMRRRMEERQVIEAARLALMSRLGIREADALQRMQTLAAHEEGALTVIAQHILAAEQIFTLLEQSSNRERSRLEEPDRPAFKLTSRGTHDSPPHPHSATG